MTERFSEDEAIAAVALLTRERLITFVEAQVVIPLCTARGAVFRPVDLARLELLCEFIEDFGMESDAATLMLSLIDRLHATQADLHDLTEALSHEPQEVRARIARHLRRDLGDTTQS